MQKATVEAIFALAQIEILKIKALIDGYGYSPEDSRFIEVPPRGAWWFIKTEKGWIEIGFRRHVYSINWEDTGIKKIVTQDNVTKELTYVHAYSEADAITYLRNLFNPNYT